MVGATPCGCPVGRVACVRAERPSTSLRYAQDERRGGPPGAFCFCFETSMDIGRKGNVHIVERC